MIDVHREIWKLSDLENEAVQQLYLHLLELRVEMETLIEQAEDRIRDTMKQARREAPILREPPAGLEVICDYRHVSPMVYGLVSVVEPRRVRYIGQSTVPVRRYPSHCFAGAGKVNAWADEQDGGVLMVAIEWCDALELIDREAFWIRHYRKLGMADLNITGAAREPIE